MRVYCYSIVAQGEAKCKNFFSLCENSCLHGAKYAPLQKNAAHIQGRTDLPHQMEIACATSISIGSRYLCIDNATLTS